MDTEEIEAPHIDVLDPDAEASEAIEATRTPLPALLKWR